MTPRAFFRTLVRGYAVVLASLVVAIAIAIMYLMSQPTTYRASAFVHVNVALPPSASAADLAEAIEYEKFRTVTYEALVSTVPVLDPVIRRLDLNVSSHELADHVTAVSAFDTNIIEVRVSWGDAQESADIANAVAQQIVEDFSAENEAIKVHLVQVTRAEPATAPVVPNPVATFGLAVFGALLFSSAWLFVRRMRRSPSSYTEV